MNGRVLVWFSCGAASAVAAKKALEKYHADCVEILYCDTLAFEHPDNGRFILDVFNKTGYLVGPRGARCTLELKREVRRAYQEPDDVHIFGLTADEENRISRFEAENPDLWLDWVLRDFRITKADSYRIISEAGIDLVR